MRRAVFAAALFAGLSFAPAPSFAQTKVGTTVGAFLGIEPSARFSGLGNTGVGAASGIESAYFNPAAIGTLSGASAMFTHAFWFGDISYDFAAAAIPLRRWGTLYASVTSLNSGEIDVRTVDRPLGTGERYTVGDIAVGLGYGRRVTQRFTTGLQLTYARERIWNSSQDFVTFSVGTVYDLTTSGLKLGTCLSNLGTRSQISGRDLAIQYDETPDVYGDNGALPGVQLTDAYPVPLLFRVGLSYPVDTGADGRLLLLADALHPNDNTESVNTGAEWTWRDLLSLRAGWQALFQEDSELGPTLGFGVRGVYDDNAYRFDYAWADHDHLQETHRLTFVLAF